MILTNDQYLGLATLLKWYRKYKQQIIEISGVIGTGTWDLVQEFLQHVNLNEKEVMYLSYDQSKVLDLAFQKLHAYYINRIIYNYIRLLDFNTLPVINHRSTEIKYKWKKEIKNKIDRRYKLIIVLDSTLLNHQTINDLSSFGIPIILLKDPMLLPAPDSYTFSRDSNVELREIMSIHSRSPLIHFANKVLNREKLEFGSYDNISIIPRKQLNWYNLKASDMNITISDGLTDEINSIYRSKILKLKNNTTVCGERVILSQTLYDQKLTNSDNKKVKVFLTKGTVGTFTKVNKHAEGTKYVGVDFRPDFYHESFTDLIMDRFYLNKMDLPSNQSIPDEISQFDYAYSITAAMSRLSQWNKVTVISDRNEYDDSDLQQRLLYTGITRSRQSLTLVI